LKWPTARRLNVGLAGAWGLVKCFGHRAKPKKSSVIAIHAGPWSRSVNVDRRHMVAGSRRLVREHWGMPVLPLRSRSGETRPCSPVAVALFGCCRGDVRLIALGAMQTPYPMAESVKVEVDHRRCVKGQHLRNQQPSHDCDAERSAQL